MKRIAVWGAGCFGQYIVESLKNYNAFQIKYFVDNNSKLNRQIPVILPEEIDGIMHAEIDEIWIAVSRYYYLGDMIEQLHHLGVTDSVHIVKPELWIEKPEVSAEDILAEYVYEIDIKNRAVITKLEYHVCDHCNLNCTGCSHFAPIYKDSFSELKVFQKDVAQLCEKFSNILRFRLMGGEPFLHGELKEFVKVARKGFPYAHLEIVTNGLLLHRVQDETWDCIRQNDAVLNISLYKPTFAIREKISALLHDKKIKYSFGSGLEQYNETGVIDDFHTGLTDSPVNDGKVAAQYCMGNKCHFLRNGKISKCALPLLAADINCYFDKQYAVHVEDYVDLYDDTISPWDMIDRLENATPFCNYCIEGVPRRFEWSVKQEVDFADYVVK